MLIKSFTFALLLAACTRETTNTKQTVDPPPIPVPLDALSPFFPNAPEAENSKRLNAATATVTLPDGTIVTHEYCTTFSGDAKIDCTDLLHAIGLCANKADEPKAKCEAVSIRDYLEMTDDDDNEDDEYPPNPE